MLKVSLTLRVYQWGSRLINLTSVQTELWPVSRASSETAPGGLDTNESCIPLVSFDHTSAQVPCFADVDFAYTWKLEILRQMKGIDYLTEINTYRAFLPFDTTTGFCSERDLLYNPWQGFLSPVFNL